ncbi:MAG: type II secretion system GspH family protein [Patescibacteria group bacterium]|nr:type II secretion system GspH family protein [Patescibacteria group bacterium]
MVNNKKGFTLIELLVVIGILAVLLAIVLIAINPARQFAQANDTKRRSDVNAILNAIHQYMAENGGSPPAAITTTAGVISDAGIDICAALVPTYIAELPADPSLNNGTPIPATCPAGYTTGYTVVRSTTDSRISVSATSSSGQPITVTR